MTRVLLTQIGKPRLARGSQELDAQYETTTYELDGQRFTTPMMGFGLAELMKPDRMVVLGTTGSAWSSLIGVMLERLDENEQDTALELMAELQEQENEDGVTAKWLERLSSHLTRWHGFLVDCQLTPYLESDPRRDTANYLTVLDSVIEHEDRLLIDVTHGLRYHPMLGLLAAQYFAVVRQTTLEGIFYGAFDRSEAHGGVTPVLRLDGMLEVLRWVQALNSFDKDGDYGVFTELLQEDQVPPAVCGAMQQAAFFERVTNASKAREQLTPLHQYAFDSGEQPLSVLFAPALQQRIAWSRVSGRGNIELRLAKQYLKRRDYLRAAIYAQEGYISKRLDHERDNVDDFERRREILDAAGHPKAFYQLKKLRNALAHGQRNSDHAVGRLLQHEDELHSTLKHVLVALENG
ncbi:TIGR02221 family CRISPR-associated protein [Halomonas campisalis]|uniref:TIGR02221 family CRISPR-associated protein n=1 Tax=Billgrantia campisalis TaxID=74661 RepID=A0ABS9P7G0_9GAMM|nr:TIGR02221 family CRISPR-associated protein [Halomonas campisalis]MCG6657536.1 TIGR02221 family CRISPR-associated protein [Halomonas campisalis]MDR5863117.1 TIGR02221 family CRISPR-associated protein [Halomonas campisalis]